MSNSNSSAAIEQNGLLAAVLTKSEAIEALSQGKKVTHRYFTPDEFIYEEGNYYVDENGYRVKPELFWFDRRSEAFETGWSLYGG
jgi:protein involved in sex pheromone biosynthesis